MYSGDSGVWDEKFCVSVFGRKDDMIVVSGENIYPSQIEEAINAHPKVQDSIATSVPDPIRGQAVVAYIVTKDKSLTVRELFEFCTKSKILSIYKRPRYFAIINELPKTATGKKIRSQMRKRAAEDLKNGLLKKD